MSEPRIDGAYLCGAVAFHINRPRSATVVITAEARLLSLSGESFQDLMLPMPEISFEISRSLSARVRALEPENRKMGRPTNPSAAVTARGPFAETR